MSSITLYDLGERIISFRNEKGSLKRIPMSAASMSR